MIWCKNYPKQKPSLRVIPGWIERSLGSFVELNSIQSMRATLWIHCRSLTSHPSGTPSPKFCANHTQSLTRQMRCSPSNHICWGNSKVLFPVVRGAAEEESARWFPHGGERRDGVVHEACTGRDFSWTAPVLGGLGRLRALHGSSGLEGELDKIEVRLGSCGNLIARVLMLRAESFLGTVAVPGNEADRQTPGSVRQGNWGLRQLMAAKRGHKSQFRRRVFHQKCCSSQQVWYKHLIQAFRLIIHWNCCRFWVLHKPCWASMVASGRLSFVVEILYGRLVTQDFLLWHEVHAKLRPCQGFSTHGWIGSIFFCWFFKRDWESINSTDTYWSIPVTPSGCSALYWVMEETAASWKNG